MAPKSFLNSFHLVCLVGLCLLVVTLPTFVQAGRTRLSRPCNITQFPKNGCEDYLHSECIGGECQCKSDFPVISHNHCFELACSAGQFYDNFERKCVPQRLASSRPEESHCQYTYQCKGSNVQCKRMGWNNNCVCNAGFRFDEFSGNCMPTYGIGGHCRTDSDCDDTGLRNMICQTIPKMPDGSTCQCQQEFQFNYQVDGCEPLSAVASRKNQFRTLVIIFVIAGILFGFAMSCNFSLCGGGTGIAQGAAQARMIAEQYQHQQRKEAMARLSKTTTPVPAKNGTSKVVEIDCDNPSDRLDTVDSVHEKMQNQNGIVKTNSNKDNESKEVLIAL